MPKSLLLPTIIAEQRAGSGNLYEISGIKPETFIPRIHYPGFTPNQSAGVYRDSVDFCCFGFRMKLGFRNLNGNGRLWKKLTGLCLSIISLLFVLLPFVSGAEGESSIFDKYIISGNYSAVDGTRFTVIVNPSAMKCFFDIENSSLIVENNSCASVGDVTACVKNMRKTDRFNQTLFQWVYEAWISLSRRVPVGYIHVDYSKTTVMLGDSSIVYITFGNNGDKSAENVEVNFYYPKPLVAVEAVEGCQSQAGHITWRGALEPRGSGACGFKLLGNSTGSGTALAELVYNDGFRTRKLREKQRLVVTGYVVQAKSVLEQRNFTMGDISDLSITLTPNTAVKALKYSLVYPEGIQVLSSPPEFSLKEGVYSFQGAIKGQKNFSFALKFNYLGNFSIINHIIYEVNDITHEYNLTNNVTVKGPRISIRQYTDTLKNGSGEFYIVNPTQANFTDLRLNYTLNSKRFNMSLNNITRMRNFPVSFKYNGDRNLTVSAELGYTTETGQRLHERAQLRYKIIKAEEQPEIKPKKPEALEQEEVLPSEEHKKKVGVFFGLLAVVILLIFLTFRGVRRLRRGKDFKEDFY